MLERILAGVVHRADFFIDNKVAAFQRSKVLCTVEFIVAAAAVDTACEEVVDLNRSGEQFGKRTAGQCADRVTVIFKIGRYQAIIRRPLYIRAVSDNGMLDARSGRIADRDRIAVVGKLHRDSVRRMVDRRNDRKLFSVSRRRNDGKVEIGGLRHPAGFNRAVLHQEPCIGVIGIIPGKNAGLIVTVTATVEIQADRFLGKNLSVQLRGKEEFGITILEFIISGRFVCSLIFILREVPQHGIHASPHPLDHLTAFIAAYERPVMVERVKPIGLVLFIPYAGVYNDQSSVVHKIPVGQADLVRRIDYEILFGQFGEPDQIQPFSAFCTGRDVASSLSSVRVRDPSRTRRYRTVPSVSAERV